LYSLIALGVKDSLPGQKGQIPASPLFVTPYPTTTQFPERGSFLSSATEPIIDQKVENVNEKSSLLANPSAYYYNEVYG
jgi:hypothetical protein